jgi:hypothetical protein
LRTVWLAARYLRSDFDLDGVGPLPAHGPEPELAAEWLAAGLSAQTAASWAPETVEVYRAWMHLGIGDANVAHSLTAAGLAPEDLGPA